MELDDETLAFAQRQFDLAREGMTEELVGNLEGGLPINLTNSSGDTLLILAAYYSRLTTVEALLARGADVERVNDRGQDALAAAAFRNDTTTTAMLMAAGADVRRALETAQFFGNTQVLALLTGSA